jgi:hypothetical protein
MGRPVDRDTDFMLTEHGTDRLITDYNSLDIARECIIRYDKALKQLADSPSIRNDDDYDDWNVGLEPIPGDATWTNKPSS